MKIATLTLLGLLPGMTLTAAAPTPVKPIPKPVPKISSATNAAATRKLPAPGIEIPTEVRQSLEQTLRSLETAAKPMERAPLYADVAVLLKAVRYALLHGEFYAPKDVDKAKELLQLAQSRLTELKANQPSWTKQTGTLARGFISSLDGSPQPIGLEIPPDLDWSKPVPLAVWLHGRGDKATDMHFIADRLHKSGAFQPGGCIILHPFGRQCLGFQLAGETDILEAIEAVKRRYRIDEKRILLAGFSMGGAGAWHAGAHYADQWCALHAGAGFVDVRRFLKLTPTNLPPEYVQTLWGQYDVPDYVRNLFNIPVLAYSGEVDGQKLAGDIMAAAYQAEGQTLKHLIGPGMGHKYHPEVQKEILTWAHERLQQGQPKYLPSVHWQGRTLKYPNMFWLTVNGLQTHWEDSRVDATWDGSKLNVTAKNISRLAINATALQATLPASLTVNIQGQNLNVLPPILVKKNGQWWLELEFKDGRWVAGAQPAPGTLRKIPDLQGPIDDAFMSPFVVVAPDKRSVSAVREAFYQRELAYTIRRWREIFRGDLPVKKVSELTAEDLNTKNLILFGDPESNSKMAELLPQTPLGWKPGEVKIGSKAWTGESMVLVAIYPNPRQPNRYMVLNSGPTIREKSDPNNSLQTPQLPDWAVLDVRTPPTDSTPAAIQDTGFFNETWR
ncbi:MAG: prolyl oligopeptidase family serine peptidase [Verrucomicrobiota bacterium]